MHRNTVCMRKYMKNRFIALLLAVVVWTGSFSCKADSSNESLPALPPAPQKEFPLTEKTDVAIDTDMKVLAVAMKSGWNLGNSFDATGNIDNFTNQNAGLGSLDSWGVPRAKKETVETVAKAGFKTIRIPVSWSNHISDRDYTIDSGWMAKVKEVVDWAIDCDLYVILNIHHDNAPSEAGFKYGRGYYPTNKCYDESQKFVKRVWTQIAETFKDYDGHLIFETLNEPRLRNDQHEWNYVEGCSKCNEAMDVINRLNQDAVDAIRATGGNNEKRMITVPSIAAAPWSAFSGKFKVPADEAKRIGISTHAYSPYSFAMQKNKDGGTSTFTSGHKGELDNMFNELNNKFVSKGIPVIMGEYGATNKHNDSDREAWFKYYLEGAKKYGIVCVLWDNNTPNGTDESERFGYMNRTTLLWNFPSIIRTIQGVYN